MANGPEARRPGPRHGLLARSEARPGPVPPGHGRHGPSGVPGHGPRPRPVARCRHGPVEGAARWRPGTRDGLAAWDGLLAAPAWDGLLAGRIRQAAEASRRRPNPNPLPSSHFLVPTPPRSALALTRQIHLAAPAAALIRRHSSPNPSIWCPRRLAGVLAGDLVSSSAIW
jgi:hypothetical protein